MLAFLVDQTQQTACPRFRVALAKMICRYISCEKNRTLSARSKIKKPSMPMALQNSRRTYQSDSVDCHDRKLASTRFIPGIAAFPLWTETESKAAEVVCQPAIRRANVTLQPSFARVLPRAVGDTCQGGNPTMEG